MYAGTCTTLQPVIDDARLKESLLYHVELRGALILAGKQIRKLNFDKRDIRALVMLRRVLRDARIVVNKVQA